jgi:hypothetical protein
LKIIAWSHYSCTSLHFLHVWLCKTFQQPRFETILHHQTNNNTEMKRSAKARGTKKSPLILAIAKLVFYLAIAIFTKAQFDEMGEQPLDSSSSNKEQAVLLPKQKTTEKTALVPTTKLTNQPE